MKNVPTVFLIDDDTDDQEIFNIALKRVESSAKCVFANDGLHALEVIQDDNFIIPDFIFIDINMPRMNGHQCLKEIKKIDRLKHVPVYMYSTSADRESVENNKKMGAVDFIVKPFDINILSGILSNILKNKVLPVMLLIFILSMIPGRILSQTDSIPRVKELKKLSVEELMNLVVTSVSKTPEKLAEVASAIQVITNEEIQRSGTLRLPGALRLATNMEVRQTGSHDWRITSRGFNGFPIANSSLADKLLVLIDGRSVYTPLFGGVYWDVQNVLQHDIKQIEVISGPGGALWGANAVNGIVNIITKSSKETQGLYVAGASGSQLQDFGAIRYGSHIDTTFFFRVYAQRYDINDTKLPDTSAHDQWNNTQEGFRMDYIPSNKNMFTLQGDLYQGVEDDTASTLVNGQNIIGRWTHSFSEKAGLIVQTYYDRTYRNIQRQSNVDELKTFDIDVQHNFLIGKLNKILWGLNYRLAHDEFDADNIVFNTPNKTLLLYSGFVQDQVAIIPDLMELTVGTKVIHDDFTGFEYHPTIRLAWTPTNKHTVWVAVSQAVRTPSRLDADIKSPVKFKSEKVMAYELGYRVRPIENISFSFATYYNRYTNLRSLDTFYTTTDTSFYFGNNLEANTYGFEVSANAILTNWWKLRGGYTFLHKKFRTISSLTYPYSDLIEAIDPKNQFLIQSMMNVTKQIQLDATVRYVDVVPQALSLPSVPSYFTFDLRLAWNYKWLTVSLNGQNLADKYHGASGIIRVPRSVYGKISLSF